MKILMVLTSCDQLGNTARVRLTPESWKTKYGSSTSAAQAPMRVTAAQPGQLPERAWSADQ
jgi:hypothetical protein